jgi:hypothetical protein
MVALLLETMSLWEAGLMPSRNLRVRRGTIFPGNTSMGEVSLRFAVRQCLRWSNCNAGESSYLSVDLEGFAGGLTPVKITSTSETKLTKIVARCFI